MKSGVSPGARLYPDRFFPWLYQTGCWFGIHLVRSNLSARKKPNRHVGSGAFPSAFGKSKCGLPAVPPGKPQYASLLFLIFRFYVKHDFIAGLVQVLCQPLGGFFGVFVFQPLQHSQVIVYVGSRPDCPFPSPSKDKDRGWSLSHINDIKSRSCGSLDSLYISWWNSLFSFKYSTSFGGGAHFVLEVFSAFPGFHRCATRWLFSPRSIRAKGVFHKSARCFSPTIR